MKRILACLALLIGFMVPAYAAGTFTVTNSPVISIGGLWASQLNGTSTSWTTGTTVTCTGTGTPPTVGSVVYSSSTKLTIYWQWNANTAYTAGSYTITCSTGETLSSAVTVVQQNRILVDDDDHRANSFTVGNPTHADASAAYYSPSTGGAWNQLGTTASCASISSSAIKFASTSSIAALSTDLMVRPSGESATSQSLISVFAFASVSSGNTATFSPRDNGVNGSGHYAYQLVCAANGASTYISWKTLSGTTATAIGSTVTTAMVSGHDYQVTVIASGSSPTLLGASVVDMSATLGGVPTLVACCGLSDNTTNYQFAGYSGIGAGIAALNTTGMTFYHETVCQTTSVSFVTSVVNLQSNQSPNPTVTLTGTSTLFLTSTPTLYNWNAISASSIASASASTNTSATLTISTGTSAYGFLWLIDSAGDFAILQMTPGLITATPSYMLVGQTVSFSLLNGSGLNWTAGTPGSPTLTVTTPGGSSATGTVNSQVIATTTTGTISITAGSTSGALRINDPNSSGYCTIQVIQPAYVGDSNFDWSPYTWAKIGTGSTAYYSTTNHGAYLKTYYGPTTTLYLGINTSYNAGISALNTLQCNVIIDGKTSVTLDSSMVSGGALTLATGLTNTIHSVEWYPVNSNPQADNRWSGSAGSPPILSWTITGLWGDQGATTHAIDGTVGGVRTFSNKDLFIGDSISDIGGWAVYNWNPAPGTRGTGNWVEPVATFDQAEYGQHAFGQTGYGNTGLGGVPYWSLSTGPLYYYWSGQSMTSGGHYIDGNPTRCYVNLGTNDILYSVTSPQNYMVTMLTNLRSLVGSACQIFVVAPFGGYGTNNGSYPSNSNFVNTAFSTYVTANPTDSKIYLLTNYLTWSTFGLDDTLGANYYSADGIHPKQGRDIDLAMGVVSGVLSATATTGGAPHVIGGLAASVPEWAKHTVFHRDLKMKRGLTFF